MPYLYATITVTLCLFVYGCALWTAKNPQRPVWPPRKWGWTARIITWAVTILALGSAYQAGMTSWNAWNWPDWVRWYVGFPIVFIVSSFSSLAIMQLGLDQSMGANVALKTNGLFARSRNPTYLANIALCIGFILLAASTPALIAAGALAVLYIAAVPCEENWLERTYGDAYRDYTTRVRRWL